MQMTQLPLTSIPMIGSYLIGSALQRPPRAWATGGAASEARRTRKTIAGALESRSIALGDARARAFGERKARARQEGAETEAAVAPFGANDLPSVLSQGNREGFRDTD